MRVELWFRFWGLILFGLLFVLFGVFSLPSSIVTGGVMILVGGLAIIFGWNRFRKISHRETANLGDLVAFNE